MKVTTSISINKELLKKTRKKIKNLSGWIEQKLKIELENQEEDEILNEAKKIYNKHKDEILESVFLKGNKNEKRNIQ